MAQIIAMGGGGFSMEPDNLALDRYVIAQTGKTYPKVTFLSQASGEARDYIINFYKAFNELDCQASHLSLFQPHTADLESYLLAQDVIYVGGGNTKSMLALWREWGLPAILRRAYEEGIVLAGISAGDEIVAMNGVRLRAADLGARLDLLQPGDSVRLSLFRREDLREIEFIAGGKPRGAWKLSRVSDPTDGQRTAYESWLKQPWPAPAAKPDPATESNP